MRSRRSRRRWPAYAQLIAHGKVRAIGASEHQPGAARKHRWRRAESAWPPALPKPAAELQSRRPQVDSKADYAPICRDEGLGVIPYYSLAGGFLTGKYRSAADAAKNPSRSGKVKGYLDARRPGDASKRSTRVAARHKAWPRKSRWPG